MNDVKQTAARMIARYGKEAAIHCSYNIMTNDDNTTRADYWRMVYDEIRRQQNEISQG